MVDPGEGKSDWSPGQLVSDEPGTPGFLDVQTFDAMLESGAVTLSTPLESFEPKPKAKKSYKAKGKEKKEAGSADSDA